MLDKSDKERSVYFSISTKPGFSVMTFKYDPYIVAIVKTLPKDKREYNKIDKLWLIHDEAKDELIEHLYINNVDVKQAQEDMLSLRALWSEFNQLKSVVEM